MTLTQMQTCSCMAEDAELSHQQRYHHRWHLDEKKRKVTTVVSPGGGMDEICHAASSSSSCSEWNPLMAGPSPTIYHSFTSTVATAAASSAAGTSAGAATTAATTAAAHANDDPFIGMMIIKNEGRHAGMESLRQTRNTRLLAAFKTTLQQQFRDLIHDGVGFEEPFSDFTDMKEDCQHVWNQVAKKCHQVMALTRQL
ncbi:hypothetical protein ACA910_007689 [Epithemia clementina (nom. ined.)]